MRGRRVILVLGLISAIVVGGFLAYRSSLLRSWFSKDTDDPEELSKLAGSKLEVSITAESTTGWPQWRGPLRDGRAPNSPFRADWEKKPPKHLWTAPCGEGYSSLAVVNERVYTQDHQGGDERVICLDAANGKYLWDYSYPSVPAGRDPKYSKGPRATPTIEGSKLYAVGGSGVFLCLEIPSSNDKPRLAWQHNLLTEFDAMMPQWGVACSPLIEGNLVVVQPGGKNGSVVAFDKVSGQLLWQAGNKTSGYSSPVAATIGGQRTIFALSSNALLAIGIDGRVHDSYAWATQFDGNVATPLVVDDYVFISSAYGKGCALLRAQRNDDGIKLIQVYSRHFRGMKNHHSTSVYKDRFLYGFDGERSGRLKCIEFNTGNEKPGWESSGMEMGTIILTDNHLIIQTERGELCLVEATPAEFRLLAKIPKVLNGNNNWSTPTLVEGKLYLRDDEKIVCYDVRP